MNHLQFSAAAFAPALAAPSYASRVCEVKSCVATAAMAELYTSEGCSSHPPADHRLSDLRRRAGGGMRDPAGVVSQALGTARCDAARGL